eukprot:scaffold5448_cov59-Phaeocystis_antarctica.AAC.5
MSVTLDVFQLETSSSKVSKFMNSCRMSVIDETTQPEIGPYVLRAAARSLTHIWTAACREALVVKVVAAGGEGGGVGHAAIWLATPANSKLRPAPTLLTERVICAQRRVEGSVGFLARDGRGVPCAAHGQRGRRRYGRGEGVAHIELREVPEEE